MSSAFRRTLPSRPDLSQQRKLAKELLRSFRSGDAEAITRVRGELPDKRNISLADAQFVLAREYGFPSWRELKAHIERVTVDLLPPIDQFRRAVREGDAQALGRVLARYPEARASINAPIFSFDSPAIVAVSGRNDVELVNVLLEWGADPNARSDWWAGGFHALYGARGEVAERLLEAGAVPDMCAAANLDRADLLSAMLAENAERVHERGGDGQTPLHFARSRKVIDLLLDAGADPDARDVDHRATAAQWMIGEESRRDLAKYLIARGASADIFLVAALGMTDRASVMLRENPALLSLRTSQGEYGEKPPSSLHIYEWTIGSSLSPMQAALKFEQHETLAAMESFATPEQRLLLACHRGDESTARAIVAAHAGIVARLTGADRRALTDEAWSANARAVSLMLELGFDPSIPSASGPTGGTALHCAAWRGSVESVEAILRHSFGRKLLEVKDATHHGTPLGWTSHGSTNCGDPKADHAGVARALIAAGARLDPEMAEWEGSEEFQAVIDAALRKAGY